MAQSDEAEKAFRKLVKHSFWAGALFVAIFLIAIGLDQFVRLLRWLDLLAPGTPLEWAILAGK